MKELEQLFWCSEQILKLQKLKNKEYKEVYDLLINDFLEKEEEIVKKIEEDDLLFQKIYSFIKENYGYDFSKFYLLNMIELSHVSLSQMQVFVLLQHSWEFLGFQEFSALSKEKVCSLGNNEYFRNYWQSFLNYRDFEYFLGLKFLKEKDQVVLSFLNHNGEREMIDNFFWTDKSLEWIFKIIREIYSDLVSYRKQDEKYLQEVSLFRLILQSIPKKYSQDVWNVLQSYLFYLDYANVYTPHFNELNSLLQTLGFSMLEDPDDRYFYGDEELDYQKFPKKSFCFSYDTICNYDLIYQKLEELGIQIWDSFHKIVDIKNDVPFSFMKERLFDLLLKEKKIFQSVDFQNFQFYLRQLYQYPKMTYFPFGILDMFDTFKIENFVRHRILNYQLEDLTRDPESFLVQNLVQTYLRDDKDFDSFSEMFFWLIQFYLKNINQDQFIFKLNQLGFPYEEYLYEELDKNMVRVWAFLENEFLIKLYQKNYFKEFFGLLFLKNQEMERYLKKNFQIYQNVSLWGPPFYKEVKEEFKEEVLYDKDLVEKRDDLKSWEFYQIYLEGFLKVLNEKDQGFIRKFLKECEEKVKLIRKKS